MLGHSTCLRLKSSWAEEIIFSWAGVATFTNLDGIALLSMKLIADSKV